MAFVFASICAAIILFVAFRVLLNEKNNANAVDSDNVVDQRNCTAGGDIVGRDKIETK